MYSRFVAGIRLKVKRSQSPAKSNDHLLISLTFYVNPILQWFHVPIILKTENKDQVQPYLILSVFILGQGTLPYIPAYAYHIAFDIYKHSDLVSICSKACLLQEFVSII